MKFRKYLGAVMLSDTQLAEGDLLGAPSTGASTTPPTTSSPEPGHEPLEGGPTPTDSGRPPGQMDDHMKKALQMSNELGKTLASLPPPWNKQFHRYVEVLRSLIAKLKEIA